MGLIGELYNESPIALRLMAFYLLESLSELEFSQIKKPLDESRGFRCSGNRTRTCDLRVMSPTSYLLLYPAMWMTNIR